MAPHDRDQFDQLLDGALRRYAEVEPRAGLEGRVLANLAINAGRTRARWAWAVAGASAMGLVVAVWVGIGHHRTRTPQVAVQSHDIKGSAATKAAVITEPAELNKSASKRARSRRPQALATVVKAVEPRLEQFPSPRPVTQQELAIAEYVEHFPEEARLMVQEQRKFDEEIQKAEQQVENDRNSENLER